MILKKVKVQDVKYNRDGNNKVLFVAEYPLHYRRGVVVYNTITKKFTTHISDISLLLGVCRALSTHDHVYSYEPETTDREHQ